MVVSPLIRDPDRGHLTGTDTGRRHRFPRDGDLTAQDLDRIVLDPPRLREQLGELLLRLGDDRTRGVEQQRP